MHRLALLLALAAGPAHAATDAREIASNYLLIGMSLGGVGMVGISIIAAVLRDRWWGFLVVFPLIGLFVGLLLLTLPAHAAGNAPPPDWAIAPEPEWAVTVQEVTCMELGDCCGVHRECGPGARPPAPVPLPATLLLLTAAIAALIWKGSYRV